MSILNHERLHTLIEKLVGGAANEVILISAFCTSEAARRVLEHISPGVKVSLVTRWSKRDIAMGSSDLEVFEVITERRGRVFRNPLLHAKLFMSDKEYLIFGSANMTARGLGIAQGHSNIECMSHPLKVDSDDIRFINSIIRDSQIVTQELIDALKEGLEEKTTQDFNETDLTKVSEKPTGLFVNDLPFTRHPDDLGTSPESKEAIHDRGLFLGEGIVMDAESLKHEFASSHVMAWVDDLVTSPMSFGAFSAALHNALIDDPRPYRKEVKALQSNLFAWIQELAGDRYTIEVPQGAHSQIIKKI